MRSLNRLVWRNLKEHWLRAVLSGLAVSFGVAMIIAADLVGSSLLDALLNADVEGAEITHGFIAEQFDQMISIVGYVLMAAACFLVFNAFTMTITQRQRQIGALRCLGMTQAQVLRLVLLEGSLLGVMGVGVGLLAGPLMGYGVIAFFQFIAGDYLSFSGNPTLSVTAVTQAGIMGIGVTLISVWWPSRRASRVAPLAALRLEEGTWQLDGKQGNRTFNLSVLGLILVVGSAIFVFIFVPGNWADAPVNTALTIGLMIGWLTGWVCLLPLIIRLSGRGTRRFLGRWGANGRLIGDNLQREIGRVMLTILTLALGLVMIVGMTGFMTYMFDELFGASLARATEKQSWAIFPFELSGGVFSIAEADTMLLPLEDLTVLETAVGDQATVAPTYFVLVPELSFLGDSYFSYVLDPKIPRQERAYFEFSEGNWEQAWPLLQDECGLLVAPSVAQRNNVGLYESLTITTLHGPLNCTIAGIGRPFMNASIINSGVSDYFDLTAPVGAAVFPFDEVDGTLFNSQMEKVSQQLPHLWMTNLVDYSELVEEVVDLFAISLNVLLLLVIVAAAFGVVNTMMMSVVERRTELGLLRAVGATRRQTKMIVVGEAVVMGVISGILGIIVGIGVVFIIVLVFGGRSWGILDLNLWAAARRTLPLALINGVVGLIFVPIIAGLAAWLPVRSLVKESTTEILKDR